MQYGINNVPDEYLEKYAQEVLQKQDQARAIFDRVIDTKLTAALKEKSWLEEKEKFLRKTSRNSSSNLYKISTFFRGDAPLSYCKARRLLINKDGKTCRLA